MAKNQFHTSTEEEEEMYAEIGRRRHKAYLRSQRHTLLNIAAAVLNGWTHWEIRHFIATGEQPKGKEFGDHD